MVAVSVARRFCSWVIRIRNWGLKLGDGQQDLSVDNLGRIEGDPVAWRIHCCVSSSRSRRTCFGARRVESNLVVSPKALEEPQGSTLATAVRQSKLQGFSEGSVPVDRAKQPVLEKVDGANEIGDRLISTATLPGGRRSRTDAGARPPSLPAAGNPSTGTADRRSDGPLAAF